MITTTAASLSVMQNLPCYQAMTAAEPAVKSPSTYYDAKIGNTTEDFVGACRLLSYALDACGLGEVGAALEGFVGKLASANAPLGRRGGDPDVRTRG